MNILIIYHTRTNRTEELAQEIVKGVESVPGSQVLLRKTTAVTRDEFLNADAIIAGSPVYFGTMAAELKKVFDDFVGLRKRMENKIGAAFASAGYHTGGKETTIMSILQAFLIYGMIVVGDPLSASGHYGVAFSDDLDDETRDYARQLGARVAKLAKAVDPTGLA